MRLPWGENKQLKIICRTHADAGSGLVDLMRVLTLSDALREKNVRVRLALGGDGAAFDLARERGYEPETCSEFSVSEADRGVKPDAIVVDSYLYQDDYLASWRDAGVPVAIIDDLADRGLRADLVINPNITAGALRKSYQELGCERLLLGLNYALLRKEILAARDAPATEPARVLVVFGATDIGQRTAWVVSALNECSEKFALDVVIGPGANTLPDVEQAVREACNRGRQVTLASAPENLPKRLAQATLAISAGGVTATELAYLGRPAILLPVAKNQQAAAHLWYEKNVHRIMKDSKDEIELCAQVALLLNAPHLRRAMGTSGRLLVDGEGVLRVTREVRVWLGVSD